MQVYNITPQDWLKSITTIVVLYVIFQSAAILGQAGARLYNEHQMLHHIKARISLDMQFLDVGNQALNTPPNQESLKRYLARINHQLETQQAGVWLVSVQSVTAQTDAQPDNSRLSQFVLENSEQSVTVQLATRPLYGYLSFSLLALLAAFIASPLLIKTLPRKPGVLKHRGAQPLPANTAEPEPKLVINLNDKTIGNGVNNVTVQLQNKPLCFYIALLRYCIDNPHSTLLHHKDIPAELTALASKVFIRLMELGHTKRKRPDFNANLDKTLSEIRAALDEVFTGFSEQKTRYYPPRAQGEGSRSKQHSYALPVLDPDDIQVIGD
ncbi:hypothetical protein [Alteromonas gilva]|uniref:Uncharacterized protein n=1 Tax=Alteromonas gilva TaxID=2987522 RepID=A0ABT5L5U3_9ALTE|nr:hypothetical protein [Alteromonas gilva]MDC8832243.1 hypothetical protein [Alteromonas gilva]